MMGEDISGPLADAIHRLNEQILPILEATAGYRQRALDAGLGSKAADELAVHYHQVLMAAISNANKR